METQKQLGILTSGDCPGLNAVIRAVLSHTTVTFDGQAFGTLIATEQTKIW
jgi:ATP-dependent phosphofructokinase / diphosphate-dependent phosphofructokinase